MTFRHLVFVILFLLSLTMASGCKKNSSPTKNNPDKINQEQGKKDKSSLPSQIPPIEWNSWSPQVFAQAKKENKPLAVFLYFPWGHRSKEYERIHFGHHPQFRQFVRKNTVPVKANVLTHPELGGLGSRNFPLPAVLLVTPDGFVFAALLIGVDTPVLLKAIRQGVAIFRQKPQRIAKMKQTYRARQKQQSQKIQQTRLRPSDLNRKVIKELMDQLKPRYDQYFGGFGKKDKVFHLPAYQLFLWENHFHPHGQLVQQVNQTLAQLQQAAVYDRLAGGFHRASYSRGWDAPFYEKPLVTSADILHTTALVHLAQPQPWYQKWALETSDFLDQSLARKKGGYWLGIHCSAKKGDHGSYYMWKPSQIKQHLDPVTGKIISRRYGLDLPTEKPDQARPLAIHQSISDLAEKYKMTTDQIAKILKQGKDRLLEARQKRPHPPVVKSYTLSSNGRAGQAFFAAYRAFARKEDLTRGTSTLDFLLTHQKKSGLFVRRKSTILLADQVETALAMIDGYSLTGETKYLESAHRAMSQVAKKFGSPEKLGGLTLGISTFPGPAGNPVKRVNFLQNSRAALAFLSLAPYFPKENYRRQAAKILTLLGTYHTRWGQFASTFCLAVYLYIHPPVQVLVPEGTSADKVRHYQATPVATFVRHLSRKDLQAEVRGAYREKATAYLKRRRRVIPVMGSTEFGKAWKRIWE